MSAAPATVVLLIAAALAGCGRGGDADVAARAIGDPGHGRALIRRSGCGSCHSIPGVRGANGRVGPPLDFFAARVYIAGEVPNTPANLVRWIVNPQAIEPATAMPVVGLDEGDARDVAAYLYTLQ